MIGSDFRPQTAVEHALWLEILRLRRVVIDQVGFEAPSLLSAPPGLVTDVPTIPPTMTLYRSAEICAAITPSYGVKVRLEAGDGKTWFGSAFMVEDRPKTIEEAARLVDELMTLKRRELAAFILTRGRRPPAR